MKLRIGLREYLDRMLRPLGATLAMSATVLLLKPHIVVEGTVEQIIALFVVSLCGAVVYSLLLLGLWRLADCPDGAESFCLHRVKLALTKARFKIRDAG